MALLVREYEEALRFYSDVLGFELVEDTPLPEKRWIRIEAPGGGGSEILLSRAVGEIQRARVGDQAGGRVLFFLPTAKKADEKAKYMKVTCIMLPRIFPPPPEEEEEGNEQYCNCEPGSGGGTTVP